jgi:hypothetical protein
MKKLAPLFHTLLLYLAMAKALIMLLGVLGAMLKVFPISGEWHGLILSCVALLQTDRGREFLHEPLERSKIKIQKRTQYMKECQSSHLKHTSYQKKVRRSTEGKSPASHAQQTCLFHQRFFC